MCLSTGKVFLFVISCPSVWCVPYLHVNDTVYMPYSFLRHMYDCEKSLVSLRL